MRKTVLFAGVLLVAVIAGVSALKLNSSNAQTTIPIGVDAYANHIPYEPSGLTYVYKYIVPGGENIVADYIRTAYANGKKPVLVVYTNYDSTTPNWSTWDGTMNAIRQDGREVDVIVEPDLFGYIRNQGACGTTGKQLVDRFLSTAPSNARLGFFMSPWNLGDGTQSWNSTPEQDAASWRSCWLAAGGDRMPSIYVDVTDRDQEYKGTYPWPLSRLQLFESWFKALKNATGRKIGVWQIPLGNSQCLNQRRSNFVENWLVESKLLELAPYVDKMLFGPGIEDYDPANTQSWNLPQHVKYECGLFNSRVTALSNAPAPTTAPPTSTPVPPTRTNTPVPPTSTPVPPTRTNTPVPPTSTPVPPTRTNTPVPPTSTPVPPTRTNTPVPPTSTPVPPTRTSTPVPPTSTPTPPTSGLRVEAESMWLSYRYGQAYSDPTAVSGRALLIWSNATASKTITLPSAVRRLVVRAKGDQCYGAPRMSVWIDGKRVLSSYVYHTEWATYTAWAELSAGSHSLGVKFDNDYYGACDRNLRVDLLTFVK